MTERQVKNTRSRWRIFGRRNVTTEGNSVSQQKADAPSVAAQPSTTNEKQEAQGRNPYAQILIDRVAAKGGGTVVLSQGYRRYAVTFDKDGKEVGRELIGGNAW